MRLFTVAGATFREAVRQPVALLILCIAAAVTFLAQFLNVFHFSEESAYNAIRQMSVASTLMAGVLIAIFSASAVLADEIENRTVLTLLAKPVRRSEVIIGKFLGLLLAISLAFVVMMIISLITTWWVETDDFYKRRANPVRVAGKLPELTSGQASLAMATTHRDSVQTMDDMTGRPAGIQYLSAVGDLLLLTSGQSSSLVARAPLSAPLDREGGGHHHSGCGHDHGHAPGAVWTADPGFAGLLNSALWYGRTRTAILLEAFLLAFMQVAVMTAVAIAIATRLPLVFNALLCAAVFILGNLSAALRQALLATEAGGGLTGLLGQALRWPVIVLCYLLPDFEMFNLTEALAVGRTAVPSQAVTLPLLYGIIYTAVVLVVATELFRRREVA